MAQHTPGPWAFRHESGEVYYSDGDVEPLIATVHSDNVDEPQFRADAALIAAAPEMFAALRQSNKALEDAVRLCGTEQARAINVQIAANCAAIAEAEGR
jgi:hypothetical protein